MLSVPSGILAVVYVSKTSEQPNNQQDMKTENQIELTQTVAPRRNLALRTTVAPW